MKAMPKTQDKAYRGFLEILIKQVNDKCSVHATTNQVVRKLRFAEADDVDDL